MRQSDLNCVTRSLEALVYELISPPDYHQTHSNGTRVPKTGGPRRRNGKRKAGGRRNDVQPFIKKIYQIINDPAIPSIYWTQKGNSFVINKDSFEDDFLRLDKVHKKPIQTKEFPSFVRQLNLYGFRKRREEDNQPTLNHYVHKDGFFLRGREKLLTKIVRSGSSRETVCSMSTTATVMSDNGSDTLSTQVQSCYDEKKNYFGAYTDYGHHHHHAPPPIFNTPFYTNANATQQSWENRDYCQKRTGFNQDNTDEFLFTSKRNQIPRIKIEN